MDTTIKEFIEQMRQGMNLMRDACEHIPWKQCPNCPFQSICYEALHGLPTDWPVN